MGHPTDACPWVLPHAKSSDCNDFRSLQKPVSPRTNCGNAAKQEKPIQQYSLPGLAWLRSHRAFVLLGRNAIGRWPLGCRLNPAQGRFLIRVGHLSFLVIASVMTCQPKREAERCQAVMGTDGGARAQGESAHEKVAAHG